MRFLNVGGGSKTYPVPGIFAGWEHHLLDIDPALGPDILCDAREMPLCVNHGYYDAILCSHNLEHHHRHDVPLVLDGFRHALKDDGFAYIQVPNMQALFRELAHRDITEVMYQSPAGPITALDMIYGFGPQIERNGNDFMAHRNGFTPQHLGATLTSNGFPYVFVGEQKFELFAFAFKNPPTAEQRAHLKLKDQP